MKSSNLWAAVLAMPLLASAPALAYEPLATFLALVPADVTLVGEVFSYSAPHGKISYEAGAVTYWPADQALLRAMMATDQARAMTGVDFTAVKSVFLTGQPPSQVTILGGVEGFAAGAPEALAGRGFAESSVSGYRVFAFGEDFRIDVGTAGNGDPFGAMMGKSQRLAIADDHVIRAASWPDINAALAALAAPGDCAGCLPYRALLSAVEGVAGSSAALEAATGWTLASFAMPEDPLAILDPVAGSDKDKGKSGAVAASLPPFMYALFAATRDGDLPAAHIALLFPDYATAETGAAVVAERLEALMAGFEGSDPAKAHKSIAVTTLDVSGGAIAVVTLDFGADTPDGAVAYTMRWLNLVYSRQFPVLAVF